MTNLPERRDMRISDTERDHASSILREAAGDGRLDFDELDERLSAVYAAKTFGDLEPITRDLPQTSAPASPASDRFSGTPGSDWAVGIMGGFSRKGTWVVPKRFSCFAFWGGGEIDLREARFAGQEVTIRANALMGGIEIIVPEDAEVHINGIGIMGGFDSKASGSGNVVGGPRINITGIAFWGGVSVERRPSEEELKRQKAERKRERRERRGR